MTASELVNLDIATHKAGGLHVKYNGLGVELEKKKARIGCTPSKLH